MGQGAKPGTASAKDDPDSRLKPRVLSDVTALGLEQRLAEAVEQQAAINEILSVMSGSPGDVQPVLDAVAERAAHLCAAPFARVMLADGDVLRAMAEYSLDGTSHGGSVPLPLKRSSISGRAVLDRVTIHHSDVVPLLESEYPDALNARGLGLRAVLAVPLMRGGNAYGAIFLFRREPRSFAADQVALVETFARQAAIAIDNTRLFNETKEALEQQIATSDILRVIASSPGDLKPMLHAVTERALKLCEAADATILLTEGERLRVAARFGGTPGTLQEGDYIALTRGSTSGRAVIDRVVIHMEDLATAPEEQFPIGSELQRRSGHRAIMSVPLMREDRSIGAITLWRMEARRFTDQQIALVNTFADQAAIAIENVRLFDEVQARTRELSESLHQQTATADVLKIISRSAFDLQTVLDTLTESACKLCDAEGANIWRPDGDGFKVAAMFGQLQSQQTAHKQRVIRPGRDTCAGRALLEGRTIHIPDTKVDPEYKTPEVWGNRALVGVPLLREGAAIGVLVLTRREARPFTEKQIALATTFADQAAIAIENVRLFNETKEALEQQTAISEILRVMSNSPTDVQPVFDIIGERAIRLCDAELSVVSRVDGEMIRLAAVHGVSAEATKAVIAAHPMPLDVETLSGRTIRSRDVQHLADVLTDPLYAQKDLAKLAGWRGGLGVPMLRDDSVIGAIFVGRRDPGRFSDSQIALLKTFADQAAIAIQNVRLFNETKEALEQQTATSEILRVISGSPTRLEPVLEAVVSAAARFCGAPDVVILRVDGDALRGGTGVGQFAEIIREREGSIAALEIPISRGSISGRSVSDRRTVHVRDLASENEEEYPIGRQLQRRFGHRTCLATPLLREGVPLGVICLFRMEVNPFSEKQIGLLRTFADQAVIAIENVRLFTELEERTRALTRSVGELKALGEVGQAVSSTLDLETVLSTIVSRATQLAGMDGGSIWEYDEVRKEFYLRAAERLPNELVEAHRAAPIRKGEGALGRLATTGEPIQIRDIVEEPGYPSRLREILIRSGYRSVLAVPLLREDHLLGALAVNRRNSGDFAPAVIELLKTFATQSALAIQNARLFREVEVKSRELETASRHKSEFLANMSHELRTPLNAIIGFSEVLSERMFGDLNEKQAEYIGDILQSGQHLLSLINDILDLSKIEAGRMELELSDVDLPSIIENTLILVRERAVRRGIALQRSVGERLGTIRADERKVKQVLLNLLSNALKFTPEGGKIDVQADVSDSIAEISVTDTGVGIAPEDQDAVFEEFRQVGTAAKKVEGTGLGLAISRKFIELHGGRIWVKSTVGSGSTFSFTLPLR
jgi:GAF domain-containing protein